MAAEDFFARWSRPRKQNPSEENEPDSAGAANAANALQPAVPTEASSQSPPTMEDVSGLTRNSDYSRFIARDVDEDVKRSAMKKLFSDPRYNVMDGLDTYIGDYHSFEPVSSDLLHALNHAQALLDPLAQLGRPSLERMGKMAGADGFAPSDAAIPERSPAGTMQALRSDASRQAADAAENETTDPDARQAPPVGAALAGIAPNTNSPPDGLARVRT